MSIKRKEQMEFRYYEMQDHMPILALLGDNWKMEYGKDASCLHFHNYMEIGWCHYGTGTMTVESQEVRFEPDMFTVIPKNIPHKTLSDKGNVAFWEYLFLDTDSFLKEIYREDASYARMLCKRVSAGTHFVYTKEQPEFAALLAALFREMEQKREFYKEKSKGLLHAVLMEIVRNSGERAEQEKAAEEAEGPDGSGVQITAALHYIEEHYAEDFKIQKLADVCHMSQTHFRRVFGEIMHMAPLEYVNLVRVEAACELIRQSELSIAQISEQTGFGVPSTLNRNFNKIIGMSPQQWKKNPGNFTGRERYRISALRGWY